MKNILRNPPADGLGQNIYRGLPGEEAALARGIAMWVPPKFGTTLWAITQKGREAIASATATNGQST